MKDILLIEDDLHLIKMLSIMLDAEGYRVTAVRNGREALSRLEEEVPSLVLLDFMMPGMDGLDVLREIKRLHSDLDVIVMTGHGSERLAVEVMKRGAANFVQKPFSKQEILKAVRHTMSARSQIKSGPGAIKILIVDDDPSFLESLKEAISGDWDISTTDDPYVAIDRLQSEYYDVLITDVYMPKMDGVDLLKRAKVLSPGTGVIVVTGLSDVDTARRTLKQGAFDYLSKPINPALLKEGVEEIISIKRRDAFERMKKKLEEQESKEAEQFEFILGIVEALIIALEARDPYTKGHSERVTEYSVAVAMEMGMSKKEIETIRHSARLHDLGKIGTDDTHLFKTTALTRDEMTMVARHPEIGCNILKSIKLMDEYIPGIRHHHERYDGGGYPDRLRGVEIPLPARVISIADSFDAMTSSRPYRKGLAVEYAVSELEKNRGTQFDPDVVDSFVKIVPKFRVGD